MFTAVDGDASNLSRRGELPCRVQSVAGARQLVVLGAPALEVGDYVIGVYRKNSRALPLSVLLKDSAAKARAQYPLTLMVAHKNSVMLRGLPVAAEAVIAAAAAPAVVAPPATVPFTSPAAKRGALKRTRGKDTPQHVVAEAVEDTEQGQPVGKRSTSPGARQQRRRTLPA